MEDERVKRCQVGAASWKYLSVTTTPFYLVSWLIPPNPIPPKFLQVNFWVYRWLYVVERAGIVSWKTAQHHGAFPHFWMTIGLHPTKWPLNDFCVRFLRRITKIFLSLINLSMTLTLSWPILVLHRLRLAPTELQYDVCMNHRNIILQLRRSKS